MRTQPWFFSRPRLWGLPWGLLWGLTLAVAQFFTPAGVGTAQAATTTCTPNGAAQDCTVTFSVSGAPETWTVPAGVTSATFDLYGAEGGRNPSTKGLGGRVTATLAVTPGASYQVRVGGGVSDILPYDGYNGGGSGYGIGGGASDVRGGAFELADRLLVAGGGGGGGSSFGAIGGVGGYPSGGAGNAGGGGGTQSAGGAGGLGDANGSAGTLGQGGAGGQSRGRGGGGGGGYYGGGGGAANELNTSTGGGGGGSSYATPAATAVSFQNGVRSGDGLVIISYSQPLPDTTPPVANPTQSPVAAPSGWNNSDVTVDWNWSDVNGLDAAHCTTSSTSSGEGTITLTATCQDVVGNVGTASYTVKVDKTAPTISAAVTTPPNANGWYNNNVTVRFTCADATAGLAPTACPADQVLSSEGSAVASSAQTVTDLAGNTSAASNVVTVKIDKTAPTISAAATSSPNANGWYNSDVTVQFTCGDNLSGVASCPADETLSSEGAAVASTAQTITDGAGNSSAASNVVTVQIDKTVPVVTVTGVSNNASYTLGSVPTAGCTTSDALSGVATQATVSVTGGNGNGTGSFTATCSGATDLAGNSGSATVSYTVNAPVDACTTTMLRDNFNRANGSLGNNWAGLTGQSFYKIANNRVDVQLGGPVVWKPTTFGVNQAAFVTLSTLDATAPSQGVLLKVQSGTIPTSGMIAVVYDNLAKAVRVSTLRLNTLAWTSYGNTPAVFANGDKLLGCVQANGTVRVYRNNSLLTTVTLSAADQSFFNTKGGRIGLWTVAAPNAFLDDFGGGALTGVVSATLDTTVPDEVADDGSEITVAENFPTDDTAANPDAGALVNRAFLPLVNR